MNLKLNIKPLFLVSVISLLLFSACDVAVRKEMDKTTENDGATRKGKLIDSAVQGVKYETDSGIVGYTSEDGTFSYNEADKSINFSAGKLIIAKDFDLSKLNSDNKILPSDIVGIDRNNTSDEKLMKILRVLQSLDNDGNASNGIFIDDNTKGYLNHEVTIADANISTLQTIVTNAKKTLFSPAQAKAHYKKTLMSSKITPAIMPFVSVWKTDSANENITISTLANKYDYNYTVDWGDGTVVHNNVGDATHAYTNAGEHSIRISGKFPYIKAKSTKLLMISRWGDIAWSSFENAFSQCSNLDVNATDTPDLSHVTAINGMFDRARNLKGNKYFNDWDVSKVKNMNNMFYYATAFNQPLNNWNVSSVTDMGSMFIRADAFNQPLNKWNVSSVTNMNLMFNGTKAFNQSLNDWDVSSVTDMRFMFEFTTAFNQPLDKWNVSSVTDMGRMFYQATAFNQPLNSWNVSSVTSMLKMFQEATAFNQPLNNWNVSNVTNMRYMFRDASAFTGQDLSGWDVANVKLGYRDGFAADSGTGNTPPNWN